MARSSARARLAALPPSRPARSSWRLSALALLGAAVGQTPCPNGCSSHGVCFNGTCTCETTSQWKPRPNVAGQRGPSG
eukprot:scaffold30760_cov30-Phaeocystis_antarctica.AAC.2